MRNANLLAGKMLGAAPFFALLPRKTTDPLVNQGSIVTSNAELLSGATLVSGITPELASASMDGSNDYINTRWNHRVNLIPNSTGETKKLFASSATTWSTAFLAEHPPAMPLPTLGKGITVSTFLGGGTDSNAGHLAFNAPAAGTYVGVINVWLPGDWDGGNIVMRFEGHTGATITELVVASSAKKETWQTVATKVVVLGTDLEGFMVMRSPTLPTVGRKLYWSGVLVELGSTAGSYFPTFPQIASGEAAWTGTANESISEIGPFAKGTTRTFVGVAQRKSTGTTDVLFSSATGVGDRVICGLNSSGNLQFTPNGFTNTVTWTLSGVLGTAPFLYALTWKVGASARLFTAYPGMAIKDQGSQALTAVPPEVSPLFVGHWSWGAFDGLLLPFAAYPRELASTLLKEMADYALYPLTEYGSDEASHLMIADYPSLTADEIAAKLASRYAYMGRTREAKFEELREYEASHSARASVEAIFDDFEARRGVKTAA